MLHGGSARIMVNVRLEPPGAFDFTKSDDWLRWRHHFEQFQSVVALNKNEDAHQVSTLLYCMGEAAGEVLASTGISENEWKEYSKALRKFDEFFKVRRNVILERAKFNIRSQMAGESAEEYITTLYNLIETCKYKADTVEEILKDRLVVGIRDAALSRVGRNMLQKLPIMLFQHSINKINTYNSC